MAEDSWVVASRRRKNMKMNMSNPKESGRPPPAESNGVRTIPRSGKLESNAVRTIPRSGEAESNAVRTFPDGENRNLTPLGPSPTRKIGSKWR